MKRRPCKDKAPHEEHRRRRATFGRTRGRETNWVELWCPGVSYPTRCPEHAPADGDLMNAWPCPVECLHFIAELERRAEDVAVHGNFTRTHVENGVIYRQTFRNHQPIDEPTVWPTPKEQS